MQAEPPTIGARGIRVSALGFGGAPIGNLYAEVREADAQAALHEALERGIRYFDTAPFYGHGLSEKRMGRALAGRPRGSFVISTKVGRLIAPDESRQRPINDGFAVRGSCALFDYSGDGVRRSFEASARRLRLEYIDILLLHDIGRMTHGDQHAEMLRHALDEALPAMAALRDQGAVGAIGIGVNEQAVCLEVLEHFDLDCIMLAGRYTLLEQQNSTELMALARKRGVALLIAGPYNSGLLGPAGRPGMTYNYAPVDAATLERAKRIYAECTSENVDVGAAALQFPLAHPAVASVVAGQRNAVEVRAAVQRLATSIPGRLWERMKDAGLIATDAPVPGP
ncbi:MAG: aldo/keto reductase [Steroidobacteraceae bacterium]|jgi:D-threo-aldose 1-dehydrogenase